MKKCVNRPVGDPLSMLRFRLRGPASLAMSLATVRLSTASTIGSPPLSAAFGTMLSPNGDAMTEAALKERFAGKRVGLFFTAGWCPMCTSFEPKLAQFRAACEENAKPIEFIYVSSDRREVDQLQRAAQLDMVQVPFGAAAELKERFKVWAGMECSTFGISRRSGVPAIVVLGTDGEVSADHPLRTTAAPFASDPEWFDALHVHRRLPLSMLRRAACKHWSSGRSTVTCSDGMHGGLAWAPHLA